MNAIVIQHVPVGELPRAWRDQLGQAADAHVTVRIEAEQVAGTAIAPAVTDDPLFGMWSDREDMSDVARYIREIRASRFERHESQDNS